MMNKIAVTFLIAGLFSSLSTAYASNAPDITYTVQPEDTSMRLQRQFGQDGFRELSAMNGNRDFSKNGLKVGEQLSVGWSGSAVRSLQSENETLRNGKKAELAEARAADLASKRLVEAELAKQSSERQSLEERVKKNEDSQSGARILNYILIALFLLMGGLSFVVQLRARKDRVAKKTMERDLSTLQGKRAEERARFDEGRNVLVQLSHQPQIITELLEKLPVHDIRLLGDLLKHDPERIKHAIQLITEHEVILKSEPRRQRLHTVLRAAVPPKEPRKPKPIVALRLKTNNDGKDEATSAS